MFSAWGRSSEQGIIFRIPTTGQGIIFVKSAPRQGPYLSFLTPKRRFRAFALRKRELSRLDGNISTFSDEFLTNFQSRAQFCLKKLKERVFLRTFCSGTRYLFRNLTPRPREDSLLVSGGGLRHFLGL